MFQIILLLWCSFFIYSKCEYVDEGQAKELELFKSEMKLEISNLKREILKLKDENHLLKKEVSSIQTENEKLKILVRKTEKGCSVLETKVFRLDKENVNLRNIVDSMLVNGNIMDENGTGANSSFVAKSGMGFKRALRGNKVNRSLPMEVAFHASLSKNIPLHDNEVIPFDKVLTNLANAYDEHLGIFQAPTPGYYVFFVHFLTLPGKFVECFLMKDADIILYILAGGEGPNSGNQYGPGSNMVVVYLNTGDRVWVKAHEGHQDTGDLLDNVWNNFSGFLLYSDA